MRFKLSADPTTTKLTMTDKNFRLQLKNMPEAVLTQLLDVISRPRKSYDELEKELDTKDEV